MKILFDFPVWYIVICILIAGLGAYFLYRNDSKLKELPRSWKRLLGIFRFISLFVVLFLLLEPLLEYTKTKIEKPIVVIIQDNSESILARVDSAKFTQDYFSKIDKLKAQLASNFEIVPYVFGEKLVEQNQPDFSSTSTNISRVFDDIQERYYGRNLGAIILASDGIYNRGSNPIYKARKLKNIPVYTILLGDSAAQKDLWIEEVLHNKLAYQGNMFLVEVVLNSNSIFDKSTNLSLFKSGEKLDARQVKISSNDGIKKLVFEVEAKEVGLQKYSVVASEIEGEFTNSNNNFSFYVEVLKSKQQILLLANAPHPDVQALKSSLSLNENYDVEVKLMKELPEKLNPYDLIITHNLPQKNTAFSALTNSKVPLLLVLGNQVDYQVLTELNIGLSVSGVSDFTEARAHVNSNFSGFEFLNESEEMLRVSSPLQVPFSDKYSLGNSFNTAVFQKIGSANTTYPLLSFGIVSEKKVGYFLGEGIWRWRIQEYAESGQTIGFDQLFQQVAQLLAAKEDKSKFRVINKPTCESSEEVNFAAELYNESYQLVNSYEVELELRNENKEVFKYVFSPQGGSYKLSAGRLPPGKYQYDAKATLEDRSYTKNGEFSVVETGLELKNTQANHRVLYQISAETGGQSVGVNEVEGLYSSILTGKNMVNVSYQESEVDDLIELKYLFVLILLFLSVEWFVRKRNGGY